MRSSSWWIVVAASASFVFACGRSGDRGGQRIVAGTPPLPGGSGTPGSTPTPVPSATPPVPNPISLENAKPGDTDWEITTHAPPGGLEGYAGQTSVAAGEPVDVHLSTDAPHEVRWKVFRIGWYGGSGARNVASGGPVDATPQPIPAPDPSTGLVECHWPVTFRVPTDGFVTGAYVVKLLRDDGKQSYVPFVVRDDARRDAAVVQIPIATWQAYNEWGGESLYASNAVSLPGGHADVVSYDRPYVQGAGSGQLFRYDAFFIRWAESKGFDLVYVTNVDVSTRAGLLDGQRLFLSIGHDEYWSRGEREHVAEAVSAGVNAAFLSANDAYWQIRFEPASDGTPARHQVCYKDEAPSLDPMRGTNLITVNWRSPILDEPENELLGVMYSDYQLIDVPLVIRNASVWPWDGTGAGDGDAIALLVGYESDRVVDNGHSPASLVELARSPVLSHQGAPTHQQTTVWQSDSGAFVFAAGTIQWSWGLAKPGVSDPRLQAATENVFARAALLPVTAGDDFGASSPPVAHTASAASGVETIAGSAGQAGLVNGYGPGARFRNPTAIASDPLGTLYLADTGNDAIRRIANDATRTVTTIAGPAGLSGPAGIAVGPLGNVFVADTRNHRIVKLANDGHWTKSVLAGSPGGAAGFADGPADVARFDLPMGIAVVGTNLYVADSHNNRIRRVDAQGDVVTIAGTGEPGSADGPGAVAQFRSPTAVAASPDGSALYVTDAGNRLVRRIALAGTSFTTSWVAGDTDEGQPDGGFEDGVAADAKFMPQGQIAVTAQGLLLADTGNARLRRIRNGSVSTWAGSGGAGGTDGTATGASLGLPVGLTALPDGRIAVTDEANSTVRLVTP